jgi:hypothetical protein
VKRIQDFRGNYRHGIVVSFFREYQITDGTKTIRIKDLPSYPKLEIDKEITILCKVVKDKSGFHLKMIKPIEGISF